MTDSYLDLLPEHLKVKIYTEVLCMTLTEEIQKKIAPGIEQWARFVPMRIRFDEVIKGQ